MNLLVIKDDRVIEADSLVDLLIEEIDFELVIVADCYECARLNQH